MSTSTTNSRRSTSSSSSRQQHSSFEDEREQEQHLLPLLPTAEAVYADNISANNNINTATTYSFDFEDCMDDNADNEDFNNDSRQTPEVVPLTTISCDRIQSPPPLSALCCSSSSSSSSPGNTTLLHPPQRRGLLVGTSNKNKNNKHIGNNAILGSSSCSSGASTADTSSTNATTKAKTRRSIDHTYYHINHHHHHSSSYDEEKAAGLFESGESLLQAAVPTAAAVPVTEAVSSSSTSVRLAAATTTTTTTAVVTGGDVYQQVLIEHYLPEPTRIIIDFGRQQQQQQQQQPQFHVHSVPEDCGRELQGHELGIADDFDEEEGEYDDDDLNHDCSKRAKIIQIEKKHLLQRQHQEQENNDAGSSKFKGNNVSSLRRRKIIQGRIILCLAAALYSTNFSCIKLMVGDEHHDDSDVVADLAVAVDGASAAMMAAAGGGDEDGGGLGLVGSPLPSSSQVPVGVTNILRFGFAALSTLPWLLPRSGRVNTSTNPNANNNSNSSNGSSKQDQRQLLVSQLLAILYGIEIGVWDSFGYLSQAISLKTPGITATNSAFICSLSSIVVPVLDAVTGTRYLHYKQVIGIIIAIIGVTLLEMNQENHIDDDVVTTSMAGADSLMTVDTTPVVGIDHIVASNIVTTQSSFLSPLYDFMRAAISSSDGTAVTDQDDGGAAAAATMEYNLMVFISFLQPLFFAMGFWRTEHAMVKFPNQSLRITASLFLTVAFVSIFVSYITNPSEIQIPVLLQYLAVPSVLISCIWTGAIATALTGYMETYAMGTLTATETSIILMTEPLWGTVFAFLLLGEQPFASSTPDDPNSGPMYFILGAFFVIVGCLLSSIYGADHEDTNEEQHHSDSSKNRATKQRRHVDHCTASIDSRESTSSSKNAATTATSSKFSIQLMRLRNTTISSSNSLPAGSESTLLSSQNSNQQQQQQSQQQTHSSRPGSMHIQPTSTKVR